jgi:dUTP pyrophosphatase
MPIKFARLDPTATAPMRKHPTDAGVDVFAIEDKTIWPFSYRVIGTGITFEIPDGTMLMVWPKGRNNHLIGAGVIDAGYQGEIMIKVINYTWKFLRIQKGTAIAQLVQIPVICELVQELPLNEVNTYSSSRGASGGIHST